MNLIRALATVLYPGNTEKEKPENGLSILAEYKENVTFNKYEELKCFNLSFIVSLIDLLDRLCCGKEKVKIFLPDSVYYNEEEMFKNVIRYSQTKEKPTKAPTYKQLIQFYAYSEYIVKHEKISGTETFYEWMRVICNLSDNSTFNNVGDFRDALNSVSVLIEHADTILEFLANNSPIQTFNILQKQEEYIKAQLILKGDKWKNCIRQAELHGYFKGQIRFLLKFSGILDYYTGHDNSCAWSNAEDEGYFHKFTEYFKKAGLIFNETGLITFECFLWERALLATGNYLMKAGSNWSLLDGYGRASWKRVLGGSEKTDDGIENTGMLIKDVFDKLTVEDVRGSLLNIIKQAEIKDDKDDLRKMLIDEPDMLSYCQKRLIRIKERNVYLLSKERMSSNHLELCTFYLMKHVLEPKLSKGELYPFTGVNPQQECTEANEPSIYLEGWKLDNDKTVKMYIYFINGEFLFEFNNQEYPTDLKGELKSHLLFNDSENEGLVLPVTKASLIPEIERIISFFKAF